MDKEKLISISHNDIYIGILDMKGKPIYKGAKVFIHDNRKDNFGIVVWKKGNYEIQGAALNIMYMHGERILK